MPISSNKSLAHSQRQLIRFILNEDDTLMKNEVAYANEVKTPRLQA